MWEPLLTWPLWLIKTLAITLGLVTALVAGLGLRRLFHKITDRQPLD